jgi:hypothetical protein
VPKLARCVHGVMHTEDDGPTTTTTTRCEVNIPKQELLAPPHRTTKGYEKLRLAFQHARSHTAGKGQAIGPLRSHVSLPLPSASVDRSGEDLRMLRECCLLSCRTRGSNRAECVSLGGVGGWADPIAACFRLGPSQGFVTAVSTSSYYDG